MAIDTIHPEIKKQWHKLMVPFYDYLPMKYKTSSQRDWLFMSAGRKIRYEVYK